jgi:FkbM family methyltransferase
MLNLRTKFNRNELHKREYWLEMMNFHKLLIDYKSFISDNKIVKHIEINKDSLIINLNNGLKFFWNPLDLRSPVSVAVNNGEYESEEMFFIQHLLPNDCKICFDIGANIGWFSLHLANAFKKEYFSIYSFEPVSETFYNLNLNVLLNNFSNIRTYKLACGQKNEETIFFIPIQTGSVAASRRNILDEACTQESVQVKRLDDFIVQNSIPSIDFLKCDVEGSEIFVLQGATESLKKFKPILFIEMLRKWAAKFDYHPNDIINLLSELGYICFYMQDFKLYKVEKMDESLVHTNFFFLDKQKHADLILKFVKESNCV